MTETGKVAIVTGAGGDIGRAIVHGLREDGYTVLAADIDGAAAGRTAGDDAGVTAFAVDITDATSVTAMAEAARALGSVALLVNNAGRAEAASISEMSLEALRADLSVNLEAAFYAFVRSPRISRRSRAI